MSRHAVRRSLLLAPLSQHKGRLALSVLAIALGVALGYAVQLINQAAINEFAAAVQTLSGESDLAVRGPCPELGRGSPGGAGRPRTWGSAFFAPAGFRPSPRSGIGAGGWIFCART